MALVQQPTSAANLLALLEEDDDALRLYALQALNRVVHDFWFQIASALAAVEAFYEDEGFSHRGLAALVASKVAGGLCCSARLHSALARKRGARCKDRAYLLDNARPSSTLLSAGVLSPGRAGRCAHIRAGRRRAV